jgi:hypothetical protein
MGIWLHNHTITSTDVSKDSGQLAEILGDVSVQTMPLHYSYSWGCRTFQTASHIHILHKCCLRTFICCGWAYSCTLTPLPPQMFQRLVTMFRWNPRWCKCVNHGTIMVETVEPYKLHPISISYIAGVWAPSSVVDWHIHMAAQAHHHHHRCFKDSGELSEILGNVRVQTMPLHYGWGCITFQTASHIHILHIKGVICCRWAYGCTSTLLPPQLFPKIRDNSWLKS